ncbi:hypothetical protein SDC9_180230 [bioreactor metagenome]|uniref:Uncharacterized protein n=1 Tax=bioreactor metagenome TaxID=1076179 RepID=A0A645H255_9ZZZZ
MRVPDRLFVLSAETEMIKSNPEWVNTGGGQLPQVHWCLAENASIHALVEVNTPVDRHPPASQFSAGCKPQIADLSHQLLELE